MRNILIYFNERFPIIPVLLFAFGYAGLAVGISGRNLLLTNLEHTLWLFFIFAGIFSFFLLRQRVTDEFKDSSHDLKNFPDRPVPRGLISKRQLVLLGLTALLFEWFFVYLLGKKAIIFYLPVFLYSFLMAKEFFVSEWLNHHFNLYLLSHEIVFVFFGLFFISIIGNEYHSSLNDLPIILGTLFTAPMSIEIIRKFSPRHDKKGEAVPDTYSTVWGRETALIILVILSVLTGLFLTIIKSSYMPFIFSILMSTIMLILGRESDKVIVTTEAISFLGLALITNIV